MRQGKVSGMRGTFVVARTLRLDGHPHVDGNVPPLWVLRNSDCPSTAYGYYLSHFQLSLVACNYHRHQVDALWSPSVRKSNQTGMGEAVEKY